MAKSIKKISKRLNKKLKSTFVESGVKLNLKEYNLAFKILELIKKHNNGVIMMAVRTSETEADGIMFSCNANKPMVKSLVTQGIEYFELIPQNLSDVINDYGPKQSKKKKVI